MSARQASTRNVGGIRFVDHHTATKVMGIMDIAAKTHHTTLSSSAWG